MFTLVIIYNNQHLFTMINRELFTKRLHDILAYYELSASAFAEKMGVGRSSISHIISGRNKPSLEFVLHILKTFEEVTFDWLMLGKGNFPKSLISNSEPTLFTAPENNFKNTGVNEVKEDLFSNTPKKEIEQKPIEKEKSNSLTIDRIVIFYSDNTFREYKN